MKTSPRFFSILVTLLAIGYVAHATTIIWTNTAGGNWSVPANWNPNQVPGASDTALIATSGTYTVTNSGTASVSVLTLGAASGTQTLSLSGGSFTIGSASTGNTLGILNIGGGTLAGAGALTLAGPLNWSGGTIGGVVLCDGGTFSGSLSLNGGQVVNRGVLNWSANEMSDGNGSIFSNAVTGTVNVTANFSEGSFGGSRIFENAGQLNVAVPGTANIGDAFTNTGTVTVNGGILNLSGGGAESGPFTVVSGATLTLSSGTFAFNTGSSISGAGNFTDAGGTATVDVALNLGGTWTFSGGTATLTSTTTTSGNAVVVSGGTVNFNGSGPWQPGTLNISSGTLGGTAIVPVQNVGGLTWSGGTIGGMVLCDGGTFSGSSLSLNGGQVVNRGVLNWSANEMSDGNGSIFSNAVTGTVNVTANFSEGSFGGSRIFENAGQLNVAVPGTANIGDAFTNTGTVAVNGGILNLSGGGAESGPFTVVSGATLTLSSGTFAFNTGSSISGAGTNNVSSGTANWNGTAALMITNLTISGGTVNFNGTGTLTPGTLNISSGTLGGTAIVPVQNVGGLTWSGGTIGGMVLCDGGTFSGSSLSLNGGQVVNRGVLNWSANEMSDGNGSIFSNAVTGTVNVTANFSEGSFGGSRIFENAGQLNVAVPGTANIGDAFTNTGTVAVNGGILNLSGGGAESGPFTVVSGATLTLSSGTFAFNTGSSISGAGTNNVSSGTANWNGTAALMITNLTISGGTVNFNGTGTLTPGTLNISSGTLGGTAIVPVQNVGGLTWSGGTIGGMVLCDGGTFSGSSLSLNGGQVVNRGVLNWSANEMSDGNGSIFSNAVTGTVNVTANFSEGSFGGSRIFENAGQLNVAVPGTANIGDAFTNTGTVTVNGGILNLSGSHNLANGTLNFGITNLSNFGVATLSGASALAGTLSATFNEGFLPAVNNSWQIINYASPSGNFSQTNLPPIAVWQVTTNSTSLTIKILKLVPQLNWPAPADIVYGTALSSTQLDATAKWNGSAVPGSFTYTPPVGNVLQSGSNQTLSVTFMPNDSTTYTNATTTVTINVQKAPLAVTANNQTKTYGQNFAFAGTEFVPAGLVNGDSVSSATLTSTGAVSNAPVSGSPYAIIINNAQGDAGLTNYNITYANGTLTVNPASLGITANNRSKVYGQNINFVGTEFVAIGLQNSETIGSVMLASLGAAGTASVAGSPYSIVPSAATGGTFAPGNYNISYFDGILTVTPALLTITADSTNKIAGELLTFAGTEFTVGGLQNSETVGLVNLTSAGAPASAATGPYNIVPSAPTGGTFSQGNYMDIFVNGTLTVLGTPVLTLTALGNQYVLTFKSVSGQTYQLQSKTNLALAGWLSLGGTIDGTGETVNVTNTIVAPQSFFQLQIMP